MLLSVAALAAAVAGTGSGATPGAAESFFVSACGVSHRGWDDPIVYPDKPGLSHNHTFVGNVTTNAFSTLSSLRGKPTTCSAKGDTAAYWAPTLLVNFKPVLPVGATIYYRRLTKRRVGPFPPGLRMVGGNAHARRPQSLAVTYWDCELVKTTEYAPIGGAAAVPGPASTSASSTVPTCPPTTNLELHVNFPDCWNGRSLDSPDHHSHMAYSVDGVCPRSHPVAVPALSVVYRYKPPPPGIVLLSSGGQFSGHADFINAWDERALRSLVVGCLDDHTFRTRDPTQSYNQC